jgi:endoglucanase
VDISPAHDYPCDLEGSNALDGGIGIKICDPSVVCDEDVVAAMIDCCEQGAIPYQREVIDQGGTDASSINLSGMGVKVGGIVVVTRYPHSQSAVASLGDIEAGVDLINAFSRRSFVF